MNQNFTFTSEVNMEYEKRSRSLMCATIGIRPDLATSVYCLARYQSKTNENLCVHNK